MDALDPSLAPLLVRFMRAPAEEQRRLRAAMPGIFTAEVCEDLADAAAVLHDATAQAADAYDGAREAFSAAGVAEAGTGAVGELPSPDDVAAAADARFVEILRGLMTAAQADADAASADAAGVTDDDAAASDDVDFNALPTFAKLQLVLPHVAEFAGLRPTVSALEATCRMWRVTLQAKATEALLWQRLAKGAGLPDAGRLRTRTDVIGTARAS